MSPSPEPVLKDSLSRYRIWFYAAAVYNLVWGTVVVLLPEWLIQQTGIQSMISVPFLQAIGMMVGVYSYGFYLLAREPIRYSGLIWVGLFGKILGLCGFTYYVTRGVVPWHFGWSILTNDLIWIPTFSLFAWKHARRPFEV